MLRPLEVDGLSTIGLDTGPPHPATVPPPRAAQPKTASDAHPPHAATVPSLRARPPGTTNDARPPHAATAPREPALQAKPTSARANLPWGVLGAPASLPPHAATLPPRSRAAQPSFGRSPEAPLPPHAATLPPQHRIAQPPFAWSRGLPPHRAVPPARDATAQRSTAEGTRRSKRKTTETPSYEDPQAYLDDPEFGVNEDYEEQANAYNEQQLAKLKKVKRPKDAKKITYVRANASSEELTVVTPQYIDGNWLALKGNTHAEPFAVRTSVNRFFFFFKTSYTMDMGLSPMEAQEDGTYTTGTNRNFPTIAAELDFDVGGRQEVRTAVGAAVIDVRDTGEATWGEDLGLTKAAVYGLSRLIAELGIVFRLDLMRAEGQRANARAHQNDLLQGELSFSEILVPGTYVGMTAAALRISSNYA